jgi:carnitine-CoA ligase
LRAALLVFEGKEYTYGEFNANVNRAGNALAGLGIGQGDRVGIMLPNIPEHLYTWLGAMKLGAIDVPINPQFKGKLLRDIVDHCDLDAIVIDQEIYQDVCSDVESAGKKIVCVEDSAKKSATSVLDSQTLMAGASAEDPPATGMKGSDIVSFIFTSGTTGLPKAAMLPHGYYIHHAREVGQDYADIT